MIETVEITENNLESFKRLLGEDLSADLVRLYYRGIGAADEEGNALGAMVCELLNADSDRDNSSRICFLKSGDKEVFDAMHSRYRDFTVKEEEVVESFYELPDESEAQALAGAGFSLEKKEGSTVILTLGELEDNKLARHKKVPDRIKSIESLSILEFRNAVKQILFKGHNGILEDIAYLPMSWFDSRVSACVRSENLVPGLFLVRKTPSGVLIPVLYSAYGAEYKENMLYMLVHSLKKAFEYYPPETPVMILRQNPAIRTLTDKLIPGVTGKETFSGSRME